jgi:putative ABC transport system permease protein
MKFLPIVFRNLLRSRRRLLLTVLSIGISTFLFATLMSLPSAFNGLLRDQVSELRLVTINNAGMLYMLPRAYQNLVATMPHVEASSGYIATIAMYRGPREQIPIMGIEPNALAVLRPEWSIAPQARSALAEIPEAGLVSAMLAARYKWRVGDTVILHPTFPLVGDLSIRVVGVVDDGAIGLVIVPLDRLDKLMLKPGNVIAYLIRVDRSTNASLVARTIDQRFANSSFETKTQTEMGAAETKLAQMRLVFVGVRAISVIIVIVIALVAANTASMTVRERRKEFAVMRALGFTPRALATLMTAEGLLMGAIAGAIGCLASFAALSVPARIGGPLGMIMQYVHLTPSVAVASVAIAAAIGLLSVAIPALRATRRNIVEMLRAVA